MRALVSDGLAGRSRQGAAGWIRYCSADHLRHRNRLSVGGLATPARATGATFELAQVVELLKREIAAADTPAEDGKPSVRIDEAQVDLDLVEVPARPARGWSYPAATSPPARRTRPSRC